MKVEEKINDALVIHPAKERRGSFSGFHSGSTLRSSSVEQRRQSRSRIERAVLGERAHVADFLETIEQLRQQSAAERLPRLRDEARQVVGRLQTVFNSPYFKQLANQDLQDAAGRVFEARSFGCGNLGDSLARLPLVKNGSGGIPQSLVCCVFELCVCVFVCRCVCVCDSVFRGGCPAGGKPCAGRRAGNLRRAARSPHDRSKRHGLFAAPPRRLQSFHSILFADPPGRGRRPRDALHCPGV